MKKNILGFILLINIAAFSFEFAVIGDNRPSWGPIQPEVYEDILKEISENDDIKFVINSGDMIAGYVKNEKEILEQWENFFDLTYNYIKKPYYMSLGNHDVFSNRYSVKIFLQRSRFKRTYYSFDHENAHFVILNPYEIGFENKLSETQFQWLENDLKYNQGKFIIVVSHLPIYPAYEHKNNSFDKFPDVQKRLTDLFERYNVSVYICGHEHLFNESKHTDFTQIVSGGGGAPLRVPEEQGGFNHYLICSLEDDIFSYRLIRKENSNYPFRRYIYEDNGVKMLYAEYNFYDDKVPETLELIYFIDSDEYSVDMEKKENKFFAIIEVSDTEKVTLYLRDENKKEYKSGARNFTVYIR